MSHLFVSPHSDDVALSCGGLVARLQERGESVAIATIFCGPGSETELTSYQRRALGFEDWPVPITPAEVMGARGREDADYAALAGARLIRADEPDAIFRGYDEDQPLARAPRSDDPPPTATLEAALESVSATTAYLPLSVGGHVDHRLVHQAGLGVLGGAGHPGVGAPTRRECALVFYEDVPYSVWAGFHGLDQLRPDQLAGLSSEIKLVPEYVELTDRQLERKIAGIRAYTSQVDALFGSDAQMVEIIRTRAADVGKVGGVGPAERYWRAVRP